MFTYSNIARPDPKGNPWFRRRYDWPTCISSRRNVTKTWRRCSWSKDPWLPCRTWWTPTSKTTNWNCTRRIRSRRCDRNNPDDRRIANRAECTSCRRTGSHWCTLCKRIRIESWKPCPLPGSRCTNLHTSHTLAQWTVKQKPFLTAVRIVFSTRILAEKYLLKKILIVNKTFDIIYMKME